MTPQRVLQTYPPPCQSTGPSNLRAGSWSPADSAVDVVQPTGLDAAPPRSTPSRPTILWRVRSYGTPAWVLRLLQDVPVELPRTDHTVAFPIQFFSRRAPLWEIEFGSLGVAIAPAKKKMLPLLRSTPSRSTSPSGASVMWHSGLGLTRPRGYTSGPARKS